MGHELPPDLDPDLAPIYRLELSLGNELDRVERGREDAGSPRMFFFKRCLHYDEIREKLKLPKTVKDFVGVPEYPYGGFVGTKTSQTILALYR